MKSTLILLLLINVLYLGWEIDRGSRIYHTGLSRAVKASPDTQRLLLLSELTSLPETRKHSGTTAEMLTTAFNFESILPAELNPNTEQIINSLEASAVEQTKFASSQEEKTVCYTYGPIPDNKETVLLSNWLNVRSIKYKRREKGKKDSPLLWIYLTPQQSRIQAESVLNDLTQKGISDLRLIKKGDLLNAISLGVFSSQAAVNRRLREIKTKAKHYQPVVIPHPEEKKINWFDISIVQNSNDMDELLTGFPARFKAVPVDCNQIAMRQNKL